MSAQTNRLTEGGAVDRGKPVTFSFDGNLYEGFDGDTLASALLANDVHLVARSFKYHRPRGIYSAGSEEPCALVTVGEDAAAEPNTRATVVELYEGLVANSQNVWPSLGFDVGAINNALSGLFSAGFYYKTFMWPGLKGWRFYERFIRRAAGMGRASTDPDPDIYERAEAFCDLLIVGAGPSGIAAAMAAADSGARVMLVDENAWPHSHCQSAVNDWMVSALATLEAHENVTVLRRCTAFGYYDGNVVGLVQRVTDHVTYSPATMPRQRHWVVRAKQTILATGALERPMLFDNNDRPGIMLASAGDRYLRQFGVCPGKHVVVYTNNDSALSIAERFSEHASVELVDARETTITSVTGGRRVKSVKLSDGRAIDCDLLLSSGGWTPTIHLHSQAGGKPVYDEAIQSFLPGEAREAWIAAGSCNGEFSTATCLQQGVEAATAALKAIDFKASSIELLDCSEDADVTAGSWVKPKGKCFADIQNDVTIADLEQGVVEGYRSSELLKRYTTLGMGTDQGKTSNINALTLLAAERGEPVPAIGVTTFRPAYTPVAIGAIAGGRQGLTIRPTQLTPLNDWHHEHSAMMGDFGMSKRPLVYLQDGEDRTAAGRREAAAVREAVGICDVSTLGKIDIQGPDSAEFLERLYVNRWASLKPGKSRYGVMLREDGMVFDDGTTSCLSADHYFMTTASAHHSSVLAHMEYLLQVTWPELRVALCDVTDQWAAFAVSGPDSRKLLSRLLGSQVEKDELPFMGLADVEYKGRLVRIIRVSFSGELGFELYTPSDNGDALVRDVFDAGAEYGVTPYGLDAMDALRIEKGHSTGSEIDGNRTLADLGLAGMMRPDCNCVGSVLARREGMADPSRPTLVGLVAKDATQTIKTGSHLVNDARLLEPAESLGHVSSACFSPVLQRPIGLAFLRDGKEKHGSTLYVSNPLDGTHVAAEVVSPHFYDSQGELARG